MTSVLQTTSNKKATQADESLFTMARICRTSSTRARRLQLLVGIVLLVARMNAFVPISQVRYRHFSSTKHSPLAAPVASRKSARKQQTWLQTATVAPANVPPDPIVQKSVISASALVVLDIAFRRLFQAWCISFPSSLAGCGVLFASLLALPFGDKLYDALNPGSSLLAKWLPVFFVPSLVTLPLADGLGSAVEVSLHESE